MAALTDDQAVMVSDTDVFLLWKDGKWRERLGLAQPWGRRRFAIFIRDCGLESEDYDRLEDAGLLAVEVPADMREASQAEIAAYLTQQLKCGERATLPRMNVADSDSQNAQFEFGVDDSLDDFEVKPMTQEEEKQFLDFVNDPVNQIGGRF